jgi:hypothetical protein
MHGALDGAGTQAGLYAEYPYRGITSAGETIQMAVQQEESDRERASGEAAGLHDRAEELHAPRELDHGGLATMRSLPIRTARTSSSRRHGHGNETSSGCIGLSDALFGGRSSAHPKSASTAAPPAAGPSYLDKGVIPLSLWPGAVQPTA